MIVIKQSGNFNNTEKFFKQALNPNYMSILEKYGRLGVAALAMATPTDSGLTSSSWDYNIVNSRGSVSINWTNSNIVDGVPIAVLIQYGHATRNGSYIQGRDYINPAIKSIFDNIADSAWREVTKS